MDFGPLHIGHLYRFAVVLHNILNEDANQGKAIVFYSSTGPKERANAACLLCCYMVLVQSWSPHQVLQPISQIDPPFMPFRDAGYAAADFEISIQDIVYGVWRAKERGMIDLTTFNLEEFEQYERVDQGDLNLVSKDFVAFASPQQSRPGAPLNEPFKKVLSFFKKHNVQMVVRLNSHLYDSQEFTKRGINHIDMIFDDGTCPTMEFVQNFIGVAEGVIAQGGKIAVHCKAGLGRTGCLIGAHLIYTHGFTANECIGYMRMIRPGMMVGPQQHWLYLHQNEFRNWRFTMVLDTVPNSKLAGFCSLISYEVYKARQKAKYGASRSFSPMVHNRRRVSGRMKKSLSTAVPITSPGQPRKGDTGRYVSNSFITNSDEEYEDIEENNDGEQQEEHEGEQQQQNNQRNDNNTSMEKEHKEDEQEILNEISMDKENSKSPPSDIDSVSTRNSSKTVKQRHTHNNHHYHSYHRHHHAVDNTLEDAIKPGSRDSFTIRADDEERPHTSNSTNGSTSGTPEPGQQTPEVSVLEKRRNRIAHSPQSSWRVLRSITSPNSNKKPAATSAGSKTGTPISSSTPVHFTRASSKKNSNGEEQLDIPKARSRSGARVRNRLASQSSVNEKIISTGAIQKVSQRRKS